jgi:hypothetical protein
MNQGLVVRVQQGDQRAFEALVVADHARLYRVSYGILRDREAAEDATQQALLDIWRDIRRLRDTAKYEAWSYQLLVRLCYAAARQRPKWQVAGSLQPADEPRAPDAHLGVADRDQLEWGFRHLPGSTSETRPDGVVLETSTLTARWISTDQRIEGQMTASGPWLDYREGALSDSPTGESGAIGSSLVRVVNDDGAWEGTLDFLTLEEIGTDQGSGWLVGEDAYAGLAAYVVIDYNSPCCKLSGHITSEGRPSAPEAFPEQ